MAFCKCGAEFLLDDIRCRACGNRLNLDPLILNQSSVEPPVSTWKSEIENKSRNYSEESMREVREEARKRAESKKIVKVKKNKFRSLRSEFLRFFSNVWEGLVGVAGIALMGVTAIVLFVLYSGAAAFLPVRAYNYAISQFEESPSRLLPPASIGSGTDFTFLSIDESGAPISWDPCIAIPYVVNTEGMPSNGKELIQSAAAEVSARTGLKFVDAGETDEALVYPRQPYQPLTYPEFGKNWSPVLISWLSDSEFQQTLERFQLDEDTAGFAGPDIAHTDDYFNRRELLGPTQYVSGSVTFKSSWFNSKQALSNPEESRAIVMHEFGHLVGLDHVSSEAELMAGENYGKTNFGDGDLAGLAILGAGVCAKPHERPQVRTINYELN